jgi:ribosomal protein S27E
MTDQPPNIGARRRASSASGNAKSLTSGRIRIIRCPACGHEGVLPKKAPTTTKLKCSACGARALARECIGAVPCRWRPLGVSAKDKRTAQTQEVIHRYTGGADLPDDGVADLWQSGRPP